MTWKLDGTQASFRNDVYRGIIELTKPQTGLQLQLDSLGKNYAPILGVSFADSSRVRSQETYTRLDDLVAVYPQTAHRPFNVQLQYRVFGGADLDSTLPVFRIESDSASLLLIEQWISNSTYLLDSHPQLDVELFPIYHDSVDAIQIWQEIDGAMTPLPTADSDGANIAAIVSQPLSNVPAFAVLVHPMDQSDADFSIRGSQEQSVVGVAMLRLFDRFMEKGVIRRARLRLLVSSEEISDELLESHYADFAKSPLPLTT